MHSLLIARTLSAMLMLQAAGSSSLQPCQFTVTNNAGALIVHSHIVVHPSNKYPSPDPDQTQDTDIHATANFNLAGGFYDVCAMSVGFIPTCETIKVDAKPLQKTFQLAEDSTRLVHTIVY
jgi:hypothetical protein